MGWGSANYDEVKGLHRGVVGTDDAVADGLGTSRLFYKVGGIVSGTGTRAADGDERALVLNRFGGLRPERQAVLLGTLDLTGATTTANLGSATNIGYFQEAQVLIDVSATGGVTASLTVYIDSKLDALASDPNLTEEQVTEHDKLQADRGKIVAAIGRSKAGAARTAERDQLAAEARRNDPPAGSSSQSSSNASASSSGTGSSVSSTSSASGTFVPTQFDDDSDRTVRNNFLLLGTESPVLGTSSPTCPTHNPLLGSGFS